MIAVAKSTGEFASEFGSGEVVVKLTALRGEHNDCDASQ